MQSNLAKIENSNFCVIKSKSLSNMSGYSRCVRFWFNGYCELNLIPLFTLHLTDQIMLNKKVRQNIQREITDHILENKNEYKV